MNISYERIQHKANIDLDISKISGKCLNSDHKRARVEAPRSIYARFEKDADF